MNSFNVVLFIHLDDNDRLLFYVIDNLFKTSLGKLAKLVVLRLYQY